MHSQGRGQLSSSALTSGSARPDLAALVAAVTLGGPFAQAHWEAGGDRSPMAVAMAVRANGRDAAALQVLEPHAWTAARAVVTPLVLHGGVSRCS